jgi:hypothetical protein
MLDFFGAVFSPRKSGNNKNALLLLFRNLGKFWDTLNGRGILSRVPSRDSQCKALSHYQYLLSFLGELKHA